MSFCTWSRSMTRMFGFADISVIRKSGHALRQAVVVPGVLGEDVVVEVHDRDCRLGGLGDRCASGRDEADAGEASRAMRVSRVMVSSETRASA